jgi:glucose/arabinose dehydrogenase
VTLRVVARGLSQPLALTFAPGEADRLYVVEKTGRVRILDSPSGRVQPAPFLDLSPRVSHGSEQGLLGLAFHPRYAENGRLYLDYTDRFGDTQIIELRAAPLRQAVDPTSERHLLTIKKPYANHNGGDVVFGPDGLLYIGTGDGGAANDPHGNGQNPSALLGKLLRLDVDAAEPRPEMRAIGLRNPWRYAFDRQTGDLYIADVGQDRFEEVDVLAADEVRSGGQNLGWNVVEGLHHCLRGRSCVERGVDGRPMVDPVLEYTHRTGCSITGGFVYRGRALPELDGSYFYGDYCTAIVRSFRYDARSRRVFDAWDWRPTLDPESRLAQISSFGEDAAGELYLLSLDGTIYQLVSAGGARTK